MASITSFADAYRRRSSEFVIWLTTAITETRYESVLQVRLCGALSDVNSRIFFRARPQSPLPTRFCKERGIPAASVPTEVPFGDIRNTCRSAQGDGFGLYPKRLAAERRLAHRYCTGSNRRQASKPIGYFCKTITVTPLDWNAAE